MQFADKTTLGQSAVLGILYVSFPYALSALFLRVLAQSDRIYTRSVPTLQSSEVCTPSIATAPDTAHSHSMLLL